MAGWSIGVRAGATRALRRDRDGDAGGTCAASQDRKAGSTASGRWSGTRRNATLNPAVAGTMVLIPGPP